MSIININPTDLSILIWKKLLDNSEFKRNTYKNEFFTKIDGLDKLRSQSDYNTGSITSTTSWLLYSTVLFFKPKIIVEVGSFIGKSTFSMALAADSYKDQHDAKIYCCDHSNEIKFPSISSTAIKQFHKITSTEMLKNLDKKQKIDLIHLDGRLQPDDFPILAGLITSETIFLLDDFETNEKGVVNFENLLESKLISRKNHILATPIQNETKKNYDFNEQSTTALILPLNKLQITNQ
jgi:hypothetical protein|tara:strand:- start:107 stop:817 length:711 start_codon:yes stop_codon:yes gene_type:complete